MATTEEILMSLGAQAVQEDLPPGLSALGVQPVDAPQDVVPNLVPKMVPKTAQISVPAGLQALGVQDAEDLQPQVQPAAAQPSPQAPQTAPQSPQVDAQRSDLWNAALYGFRRQLLSEVVGAGVEQGIKLSDLIGVTDSQDPESLSFELRRNAKHFADPDFVPQSLSEKSVAATVELADPAMFLAWSKLRAVLSPVLYRFGFLKEATRARRIAQVAGRQVADGTITPQAYKKLVGTAAKATLKSEAVRLPIENVGLMALDSAVESVDQGPISAGDLATRLGIGAGLGVLGSPVIAAATRIGLGRIPGIIKSRRINEKAQQTFGAATSQVGDVINLTKGIGTRTGELADAFIAGRRRLVFKLTDDVNKLKAQRGKLLAKADDVIQSAPQEERLALAQKIMSTEVQLIKRMSQLDEHFEPQAYQQMMKLKRAFGNQEVLIDGQKVKLFRHALSKEGVLLEPALVKTALQTRDLGFSELHHAGGFSHKDFPRVMEAVEGEFRGPLMRAVVEPAQEAAVLLNAETSKIMGTFVRLADRLGLRPNASLPISPVARRNVELNRKLFRAGEGDLTAIRSLTPDEKNMVAHTRRTYDEMISRMNLERRARNLAPIAFRRDYIPHMKELSQLEKWGIDLLNDKLPGPRIAGPRRVTLGRHERARTGELAPQEDFYRAFSSYIPRALKVIHMTGPKTQAEALMSFLPNNLRAAARVWLDGPDFGGVGKLDRTLVENGFGVVPTALQAFSRMFGRAVIQGSASVLLQQPSQQMVTAVQHGAMNTVKGLAKSAFGGIPQRLVRKSTFLRSRAVTQEFHQAEQRAAGTLYAKAFDSFDHFTRALQDRADRVFANGTWSAAFDDAMQRGFTEDASVRFADRMAKGIQASYLTIDRPALLQSKAGRGALPFQTFSFNMWNYLMHDAKLIGQLKGTSTNWQRMEVLATMWLTNRMYEGMGLRSPFNFGQSGFFFNEDRQVDFSAKRIQPPRFGPVGVFGSFEGGSEGIFSFTPAPVQTLQNAGDALISLLEISFDQSLDDPEDAQKRVMQKWQSLGKKVLPTGKQIIDTWAGLRALEQGYAEIGRDEVSLDDPRDILAPVIGPTSTTSAEKHFDEKSRGNR